jgi:hypothetical protein
MGRYEKAPLSAIFPAMEPRRYTLVPDDTDRQATAQGPVRRRYSLARVAPSSRSALGVDRLERMEEIVARELRGGRH